jgi:hypothetical protein
MKPDTLAFVRCPHECDKTNFHWVTMDSGHNFSEIHWVKNARTVPTTPRHLLSELELNELFDTL